MGWRYLLFTLGAVTLLLWAFRFFVFKLEESPRYLVGRGRDAEAVAVLQRIAAYNGSVCSLTVEDLTRAGDAVSTKEQRKAAVLSAGSDYTVGHVKALFKTKKLAWSTGLLIAIWGARSHQIFLLLKFTCIQGSLVSRRRCTTTFCLTSLPVVEPNLVTPDTILPTVMYVYLFSTARRPASLIVALPTASHPERARNSRRISRGMGS